jgi:hypothetical protein
MNTPDEHQEQSDNMESLKQQTLTCGPKCGCHAGSSVERIRLIVSAIVLIAAGALVTRAVIKNYNTDNVKTATSFASFPVVTQATTLATNKISNNQESLAMPEIASLSDLNMVASETDGVFVLLDGKNEPLIQSHLAQIRSAVQMIESQGHVKIGIFRLKTGSGDYEQVVMKMAMPGVLVMAKGRGMSAVSGDITDQKLVQAFVTASSTGGCCPSSSGTGGCK